MKCKFNPVSTVCPIHMFSNGGSVSWYVAESELFMVRERTDIACYTAKIVGSHKQSLLSWSACTSVVFMASMQSITVPIRNALALDGATL